MKTKLLNTKLILSTALTTALFSITSQACEMSKETVKGIYIQPDSQYLHFGEGPETHGPITANIYKCQKSAGKYLMFSLGTARPGLASDVSNITYDGKITKQNCRIENSNFVKEDLNTLVESSLRKQFQTIRQCLYLRVRDLNRTPIQFKQKQTSCRMKEQTNGTVTMEGDYCFIKINPRQELQVSIEVKQDCLNPEFLAYSKIDLQDINLFMNAWITSDDSGVDPDAQYIRSLPSRAVFLPSTKNLKLSENPSRPEIAFPSTYKTDINPGNITIQKTGVNRYNLDFSLEVQNRSQSTCVQNLPCTSPSNYQAPVAGEVELNQIINGKKEYVTSYWHIGEAPAQWQGLLKNENLTILENVELKKGQQYEMTFTMLDPYDDYRLALRKRSEIKFNLPTPNETLDNVQPTPIMDNSRSMDGLSPINTSMIKFSVDSMIEQLNTALRSSRVSIFWPQIYSQSCVPSTGQCLSLGKGPALVDIKVQFTLGDLDPNTQVFKLQNIQIKKQSSVMASYQKSVKALPTYKCDVN